MYHTSLKIVKALVGVAVLSVVSFSVTLTPTFQEYATRTQVSEAISMMQYERTNILGIFLRGGGCTYQGMPYAVKGNYGTLVVSGVYYEGSMKNNDALLNTGCNLTYTFNQSFVARKLQGKVISADLFNNVALSRASETNVDLSLLPESLSVLTEKEEKKGE